MAPIPLLTTAKRPHNKWFTLVLNKRSLTFQNHSTLAGDFIKNVYMLSGAVSTPHMVYPHMVYPSSKTVIQGVTLGVST